MSALVRRVVGQGDNARHLEEVTMRRVPRSGPFVAALLATAALAVGCAQAALQPAASTPPPSSRMPPLRCRTPATRVVRTPARFPPPRSSRRWGSPLRARRSLPPRARAAPGAAAPSWASRSTRRWRHRDARPQQRTHHVPGPARRVPGARDVHGQRRVLPVRRRGVGDPGAERLAAGRLPGLVHGSAGRAARRRGEPAGDAGLTRSSRPRRPFPRERGSGGNPHRPPGTVPRTPVGSPPRLRARTR